MAGLHPQTFQLISHQLIHHIIEPIIIHMDQYSYDRIVNYETNNTPYNITHPDIPLDKPTHQITHIECHDISGNQQVFPEIDPKDITILFILDIIPTKNVILLRI